MLSEPASSSRRLGITGAGLRDDDAAGDVPSHGCSPDAAAEYAAAASSALESCSEPDRVAENGDVGSYSEDVGSECSPVATGVYLASLVLVNG